MADERLPLTTAETLAQTLPAAPQFATGIAQGVTDEDGTTSVVIAGPPDVPTEEDSDSSDLNEPAPVETLVRGVAALEDVVVVTLPSGAAYALPFALQSAAASIEGGSADVPIASTSPVAVTDLEVEIEIPYAGHLVTIETNMYLQSGGAANLLIGRVIREDEDGNTVEVGRFLRNSQLGNNQTIQVGVPVHDWDPEPGVYKYRPTVEASVTGWTLVLSPAADTIASFVVTDSGALPAGAIRTPA